LWKARPATHETLIKQFQLAEDEDDEVFSDWNRDQQWPQKAVTDSNASGERYPTSINLHSIGWSDGLKMSTRLYNPFGREKSGHQCSERNSGGRNRVSAGMGYV
ncbi:hypothetical protein PSTG_19573, partial [Puccinia striiformis f. sp. tritici PST-78]